MISRLARPLLIALAALQPGLPAPALAQAENAAISIPFAPPVDETLYMERTVTRETSAEPVVKTTRHSLVFTRIGRGYALEIRLTHIKVSGPEAISKLLAYGDNLVSDERLVFTIGSDGEILDVRDAAGSYERMLAAISDMRAQLAASDEGPRAKIMLNGFLTKMANMDRDAHREFLTGFARPLLQFAGLQAENGAITARDNLRYESMEAAGNDAALRFGYSDDNGSSSVFGVSRETGLTREYSRKTVIGFGGLTRITQDDAAISMAAPGAD